ncbi:MAG: hypothetical protein HYZ15_15030 [Sphingobacteriales bacterium]|nr:hypothetical protein [Sphingobacteriales bacterium]
MKIILICLIFFSACSQNDPINPNHPAYKYFFDCTVDGKHLKTDGGSAQIRTSMEFAAGTMYCNAPGSYCFQQILVIHGQVTGTYIPYELVIETTEGADTYDYMQSTALPMGNVTAKITEITRGVVGVSLGVAKGTFSGTVRKYKNHTFVGDVSVNASFALGLEW